MMHQLRSWISRSMHLFSNRSSPQSDGNFPKYMVIATYLKRAQYTTSSPLPKVELLSAIRAISKHQGVFYLFHHIYKFDFRSYRCQYISKHQGTYVVRGELKEEQSTREGSRGDKTIHCRKYLNQAYLQHCPNHAVDLFHAIQGLSGERMLTPKALELFHSCWTNAIQYISRCSSAMLALLVALIALNGVLAKKLPPIPGANTPECAAFHHRCGLAHQSCLPLCQGDSFCVAKCNGYHFKCLSTCGKGDRYSEGEGGPGGEGGDVGSAYDKFKQCYSPFQKLGPMPGAGSKECAEYHRECAINQHSCTPKCDGDAFCIRLCQSEYYYCTSTCGKGDRQIEGESGMGDGAFPGNKEPAGNYGGISVPKGGYETGYGSDMIPH
ncbi:hypothetical protein K493DRAFT_301045 [Basidiobolus meristosporus CBS 931.73]|uniref:Uncharacterized protein n=1 Tax=Basidiobolus meristosporus CBS 931.73 TaxID=1314790 RepID=A0A1Y1YDY3_9FUNG|nr:hypothetical protein K493DRAFT_301045 [Basidiobolus meristosporus CBS 931.73]|eukprot:ORX96199.1 hypothetical protein K493DRAFT_301045 [Basidiobolus meristosporus CBS 931.73]